MSVQEGMGMPLEEFIRLYDDAPFDWFDGEKRLLFPKLAGQAETQNLLLQCLLRLDTNHEIFFDAPYVQLIDGNVVRALTSSILIYQPERWKTYTRTTDRWLEKPFLLVPDLCTMIVSPEEKYVDVEDKVAEYLRDGVKLVWIINPRAKSVTIYTAGSEQITRLTAGHTLTGGEVLPDFSVPVSDIFPA